ncbi:polysaccharide lyase [Myxococcaceae bacterium GXIMD 01537]
MTPPTRWMLAVAALVAGLTYAVPASAEVIRRGDFETGDRSQWHNTEIMDANRVQVVQSPVRQGRYALRAEVRQGDDPINASGNRNELVMQDGAKEGTEFYYGWSTLWPSDYPLSPTWQVFMQWHHPGCCGAPPVRLVLGCSASDCGKDMPDTLFLVVDNKTIWTKTPVTRGDWHDFVMHIKWSANPNVGFVEFWYDGELVVPKHYARTLFSSSDTNYLKMGLYRDESIKPTGVIFHDGLVQATTLAEAQQPPRITDGGTPDAGTPTDPVTPPADAGTPDAGGGTDAGTPETPGTNPGPSLPGPVDSGTQQPGAIGNFTGDDAAQGGAGCSAGSALTAPWAWALGALALVPLARLRRGKRR